MTDWVIGAVDTQCGHIQIEHGASIRTCVNELVFKQPG